MEPIFCPNPECVHHHRESVSDYQPVFWMHAGTYVTKVSGVVPRFRCKTCGRGFSTRTFSIDYYTKKSLDNKEIFRSISSGESVSSIARHLTCTPASVQNRLDRLGRGAIALHSRLTAPLKLSEALVADGFESFDGSQYFPNNINLLLGKDSQFLYGFTHTTIRRKGRMTEFQKLRRAVLEELFKVPRSAIRKSFTRLLQQIPPLWDEKALPILDFVTDEHKAYPQSILRVKPLAQAAEAGTFIHKTYSSELPRTVSNELFSANYYDRELRKDLAAFRRETTCFTRNVGNGLLRMMSHLVWHNYQKDYRVGVREFAEISHANQAGIWQGVVSEGLERMFIDRAFLSRQKVSGEWITIWMKGHKTPLKKRDEYIPQYASVGRYQR